MRRAKDFRRLLHFKREELKIEVIKTFPPADEREVAIGDYVKVLFNFNLDNGYGDSMLILHTGDVIEVLQQVSVFFLVHNFRSAPQQLRLLLLSAHWLAHPLVMTLGNCSSVRHCLFLCSCSDSVTLLISECA